MPARDNEGATDGDGDHAGQLQAACFERRQRRLVLRVYPLPTMPVERAVEVAEPGQERLQLVLVGEAMQTGAELFEVAAPVARQFAERDARQRLEPADGGKRQR